MYYEEFNMHLKAYIGTTDYIKREGTSILLVFLYPVVRG